MRWVTSQITDALTGIPGVGRVAKDRPGGDWDTEVVLVYLSGKGTGPVLWVRGFDPEHEAFTLEEAADIDVKMVEVSAGLDSRGGCAGVKNPTLMRLYGEVCACLTEKGFEVVPKMDDYC